MDMSKMYMQMLGDMGQSARRVSILFGSGVVSTSQEILRRDGRGEEITPVQISVLPGEGDYVISRSDPTDASHMVWIGGSKQPC